MKDIIEIYKLSHVDPQIRINAIIALLPKLKSDSAYGVDKVYKKLQILVNVLIDDLTELKNNNLKGLQYKDKK